VHANEGTLRLDARLVDVSTGVATEARSVQGPVQDLFALEHALAEALVDREVQGWTVLRAEELTDAVALGTLFGRLASRPTEGPAPTIERRPETPAAPPTKKVCKRVDATTDPIEGTTVREARAPLTRFVQTGEQTLLHLRLPAMQGMRPNALVSDPALYSGHPVPVELLLADGTLITLHSRGSPTASTEIGGGVEGTFAVVGAEIQGMSTGLSVPTLGLGLWLSRYLIKHLEGRAFRAAVLIVAGLAGAGLVVRALLRA